ncbi:uncharacterized protein LOC117175433 [Belonocnema kinseyi]|uniref:uncharacterized protein LOC117175433 n=1 Tax=Belonocnema kinseyi TaxID=2817044 RepID=UPI00143CEE5C|nr:uncharacterized protein LOC117175433 [Belonocnema kinseyi]
MAITSGRGDARCEVGMAAVDVKFPHLIISQISDSQTYVNTLMKIHLFNPVEIIMPETMCGENDPRKKLFSTIKGKFEHIQITPIPRMHFNEENGLDRIKTHCANEFSTIELFVKEKYYALSATAALLRYVEYIQHLIYEPKSLKIEFQASQGATLIDVESALSLELVSSYGPQRNYSLFSSLDRCVTPMGRRLLRSQILQPPCDDRVIKQRQACVSELVQNRNLHTILHPIVKQLFGADRLLGLSMRAMFISECVETAERNLNYVLLLKTSLEIIPNLSSALNPVTSPNLVKIRENLKDPRFQKMKEHILQIVQSDARSVNGYTSANMQRCFALKSGINDMLDVARQTYCELIDQTRILVESLGQEHNLPLAVACNAALGYHIRMDIPRRLNFNISELPDIFVEVQKKKNCLYMTTDLLMALSQQCKDARDELHIMSNCSSRNLLRCTASLAASLKAIYSASVDDRATINTTNTQTVVDKVVSHHLHKTKVKSIPKQRLRFPTSLTSKNVLRLQTNFTISSLSSHIIRISSTSLYQTRLACFSPYRAFFIRRTLSPRSSSFNMTLALLLNPSWLSPLLMMYLRTFSNPLGTSINTVSSSILETLITVLREDVGCLFQLSEDIAEIDLVMSLARISAIPDYVKPTFGESLRVLNSKHPILDIFGTELPRPNDIVPSIAYNFRNITGPNMSGKTTYLKQVVLLNIMSQIGCYVPATEAKIRIVDRIFCRLCPSHEDIESNASAFVQEIKEIEYILQFVTPRSLIVLDEICRSTNVEEGSAIAFAICEKLLQTTAFIFNCTHFLYLTKLTELYHNVVNHYFECVPNELDKWGLKYTHKLRSGVTDVENYGISAASAARMPKSVIDRAKMLVEQIAAEVKPLPFTRAPELSWEKDCYACVSKIMELIISQQYTYENVQLAIIPLRSKKHFQFSQKENNPLISQILQSNHQENMSGNLQKTLNAVHMKTTLTHQNKPGPSKIVEINPEISTYMEGRVVSDVLQNNGASNLIQTNDGTLKSYEINASNVLENNTEAFSGHQNRVESSNILQSNNGTLSVHQMNTMGYNSLQSNDALRNDDQIGFIAHNRLQLYETELQKSSHQPYLQESSYQSYFQDYGNQSQLQNSEHQFNLQQSDQNSLSKSGHHLIELITSNNQNIYQPLEESDHLSQKFRQSQHHQSGHQFHLQQSEQDNLQKSGYQQIELIVPNDLSLQKSNLEESDHQFPSQNYNHGSHLLQSGHQFNLQLSDQYNLQQSDQQSNLQKSGHLQRELIASNNQNFHQSLEQSDHLSQKLSQTQHHLSGHQFNLQQSDQHNLQKSGHQSSQKSNRQSQLHQLSQLHQSSQPNTSGNLNYGTFLQQKNNPQIPDPNSPFKVPILARPTSSYLMAAQKVTRPWKDSVSPTGTDISNFAFFRNGSKSPSISSGLRKPRPLNKSLSGLRNSTLEEFGFSPEKAESDKRSSDLKDFEISDSQDEDKSRNSLISQNSNLSKLSFLKETNSNNASFNSKIAKRIWRPDPDDITKKSHSQTFNSSQMSTTKDSIQKEMDSRSVSSKRSKIDPNIEHNVFPDLIAEKTQDTLSSFNTAKLSFSLGVNNSQRSQIHSFQNNEKAPSVRQSQEKQESKDILKKNQENEVISSRGYSISDFESLLDEDSEDNISDPDETSEAPTLNLEFEQSVVTISSVDTLEATESARKKEDEIFNQIENANDEGMFFHKLFNSPLSVAFSDELCSCSYESTPNK